MKTFTRILFASGCLGILLAGCNQEPPVSSDSRPVMSLAGTPGPKAAPMGPVVTRIVFLDQKQACDCTRKRIDASWLALQAALKNATGADVLRLFHDVDEQAADEYKQMKPLMVAPGIYFLDKNGGLVEMLQGEVTEPQITAVLKGSPRSR